MSTFYYVSGAKRDILGHRTSAGRYCWDCHLALGDQVACPKCGKRESPFDIYRGPAIDQGLVQERQQAPKGVSSAERFRWAVTKRHVTVRSVLKREEPVIEREDGKTYTGPQFEAMMAANCPIEEMD